MGNNKRCLVYLSWVFMLKSKYYILTVLVCILFMSCEKEQQRLTDAPSSPEDAMVKTKSEKGITETYYYDSQKRISKILFNTGTTSYFHEFTYSTNEIQEYKSEEPRYALEETLPNGATKYNRNSNPIVYKLNKQGYYVGLNSFYQTQNMEYDDAGFMRKQSLGIQDYSINEDYTNDGKNVEKMIGKGFSYVGGNFTINHSFIYYSDKINSIGNRNFGKSFLGKSSTNLLMTSIEDGETAVFTYEFDANQRVIKKTETKGLITNVTTYTYY